MITYDTLRGNESENRTYRNSWKWTWSKWTCFLQGNEQPKRSWKRNWKNSGVTGNRTLTFALTGLNAIWYKWCNIRMNHFLFCFVFFLLLLRMNDMLPQWIARCVRSSQRSGFDSRSSQIFFFRFFFNRLPLFIPLLRSCPLSNLYPQFKIWLTSCSISRSLLHTRF